MNIVTTGDSKFFRCLQKLAESVRRQYNTQIIVYDVGLTNKERASLDAQIIQIDVDVDFAGYTVFKKTPFVQATHKPFCVRHYFTHHSEPMILVDADCLFMERVEQHGFDVGVTLKPRKHIDVSNHYNGVLNTGVIFFNSNATELVDKWINECRKPDATDQKALTDILSETVDWKLYGKTYDWHGLKIKVFKTDDYNDYYLRNGKIFHFKGERHKEDMYGKLVGAIEQDVDTYRLFRRLVAKPKRYQLRSLLKWLYREQQ
jgi:hypothetical protein